MASKIKKGAFLHYVCNARVTVEAIARTVHRDGTVTVEARHTLDETGEIRGCYLGFRYRLNSADLTLCA